MDKIIDIIGSTILWGLIILIILRVNSQINDNAFETLNSTISQMEAIELSRVIEYDIRNIGALISGSKIIVADSNEIKFYFDYNFNDSRDSLRYFLGTTSDLSYTSNPNDKALFRSLNNTINIVGNISKFKLTYYDAIGQEINYSLLSNQTNRNLIKTIQIYFLRESSYANYDGLYPSAEWKRKISPKNM